MTEHAEAEQLWSINDGRPTYTHTIFSVGWGLVDDLSLVIVHVLMGPNKIEYRMKPDDARRCGEQFLHIASFLEERSA